MNDEAKNVRPFDELLSSKGWYQPAGAGRSAGRQCPSTVNWTIGHHGDDTFNDDNTRRAHTRRTKSACTTPERR